MAIDPHAVLGVPPSASPEEVARAYREKAKRLHPDRRPGDTRAAQAMATVNAAYSMLKDGLTAEAAARTRPDPAAEAAQPRRNGDGVTDPRVRAAVGREVLAALYPGEKVLVVCDAASHESPRVRLVLTDQRFVYLMADAPLERVRSLRWHRVAAVDGRVYGRLRKRGELTVTPKAGKRLSFGEIEPDALELVVARVPA